MCVCVFYLEVPFEEGIMNKGKVYLLLLFIFIFKINLFIYFWLCWVFVAVCGLSPLVALLIAVAALVADHGL